MKNCLHLPLLLALPALACTGTDVGNGFVDVDVAAYETSFAPGAAPANGSVEIDRGWINVTAVALSSGTLCADDTSVTFAGGLIIDLFEPGAPEELSDIGAEAGGYCAASVEVDGYSGEIPTGLPPEFAGAVVLLEGTRDDGTPYILASDQDETIDLMARAGEFLISDNGASLVVALNGTELFSGIDLYEADVGDDGIIRITWTENEDLINVFKNNFRAAVRLFDDDDRDGDLEAGEREDEDVLAE